MKKNIRSIAIITAILAMLLGMLSPLLLQVSAEDKYLVEVSVDPAVLDKTADTIDIPASLMIRNRSDHKATLPSLLLSVSVEVLQGSTTIVPKVQLPKSDVVINVDKVTLDVLTRLDLSQANRTKEIRFIFTVSDSSSVLGTASFSFKPTQLEKIAWAISSNELNMCKDTSLTIKAKSTLDVASLGFPIVSFGDTPVKVGQFSDNSLQLTIPSLQHHPTGQFPLSLSFSSLKGKQYSKEFNMTLVETICDIPVQPEVPSLPEEITPPSIPFLNFEESHLVLETSDSFQLSFRGVLSEDIQAGRDQNLLFIESSDWLVADVSDYNLTLTAISPGETTLTASIGNKETHLKVKVVDPIKSLGLFSNLTLKINETKNLQFADLPFSKNYLYSANPEFLEISGTYIKSLKEGQTTLSASYKDISVEIPVVIEDASALPPLASNFSTTFSKTLQLNETQSLGNIFPKDLSLDFDSLIWNIENPTIVTLEKNAIKGISSGKTTLTGYSNNQLIELAIEVLSEELSSPQLVGEADSQQDLLADKNISSPLIVFITTVGLSCALFLGLVVLVRFKMKKRIDNFSSNDKE